MEDDRFIPTSRDLPQRVKALMFNKDDAIDAEGRYQFVRQLGNGAMGKVFLFQDTRMGDLRALKTVDEILMQYPEAVEALKKECKAMYRLTHPNIVAVRDLVMDQWGYRYYIVMDYVKGETLREYLKNHPKPDQKIAMEIIRLMAEALDYAHRSNIVHGDVKPENTMVEIGEKVNSLKLADFGLSYHIQATTTSLGASRMSVRGTPAYMAPELFEMAYDNSSDMQKPGMEVDLYALGTVAYEMLAGRRPFNGPSEIVLAHNVIYGEVLEIDGLPDDMNAALKKALAKKPGDRFENCGAFAKALSAPEPITVEPPAVTSSPRPVVVEKRSPQPSVIKKPSSEPLPKKENVTLILPGNVPLELVHIRAGSFMMGSPESEFDHGSDEVQHRVTLTKDFWLGKYEVTQGQWLAVMGSNPSWFKKGDRYPVETVSWEDAMAFCRKATDRERAFGRLLVGYEYTLPTEAQWEYACRAGTTTPFSFGSALNGDKANCDGNDPYPYGGVGKGRFLGCTSEVRSYVPNAWGLYDMHGNVWEWCRDWYESGYAKDPEFLRGNSGSNRVLRGGSWGSDAWRCRSAYRDSNIPPRRNSSIGFRVALVSVQ